MTVGVLDGRALARLFRELEGRRLLAALDTGDVLELVFEESPQSCNLVSIYYDAARHTGLVGLGSVADAESYATECRRWERTA
jgi:hypothetical protein